MKSEVLLCSSCGAPLTPGQATAVACRYCGGVNYIRSRDAQGPMAEIDLEVVGFKTRFTDNVIVTTAAPATLAITSMLDSTITGSISIAFPKGDLAGQVIDMAPENRTSNSHIINCMDMSEPTTYTNMSSSMSVVMGMAEAPSLGGQIRVAQFDLRTGQTEMELIDIRLAKLSTNAICTINGTIRTFRSANPLVEW